MVVELRYYDTWGRPHEASPEVVRALLVSMGFAAGTDEEIKRGLAAPEAPSGSSHRPDLVVREDGEHVRVPSRPAAVTEPVQARKIEWEGGEGLEYSWFLLPELGGLKGLAWRAANSWSNACRYPGSRLRWVCHRVPLMWMREPELETFAEARLIVCPTRAKVAEQRGAGLAVSLYGLRSGRNWGCGDFTDLETLIDAFAPAGAAFVALNPLHAIANRQPYNTSRLPASARSTATSFISTWSGSAMRTWMT